MNFFYEAGCNSVGLKRYLNEDGEGLGSQMSKRAFAPGLAVRSQFWREESKVLVPASQDNFYFFNPKIAHNFQGIRYSIR